MTRPDFVLRTRLFEALVERAEKALGVPGGGQGAAQEEP